ncbi:unnamed protein product [Effrenium voratum]|uniref:Transmembrane protein n=1 Tax=Effrenium voratum TaxID=2562239 RepID=A0AA36JIT2_9DINO|nr:unnamed protein product [Effrenium voratum]
MAPVLYNEASKKTTLFLGFFSFETIMLLILGIHSVFCIFLLATASPIVDLDLGAFTIDTTVQIGCGAWGLLGIMCIVAALVGWFQQRETPMAVYFWYLVVTAVLLAAVFVYLVSSNHKCYFVKEDLQTQRIGFSFLCSVIGTAIALCGLAAVAAVCFALYTISQVQVQIKETVNESVSESSRLLLRSREFGEGVKYLEFPIDGEDEPQGIKVARAGVGAPETVTVIVPGHIPAMRLRCALLLLVAATGSKLKVSRAKGIFPSYDGVISSPKCGCHCCVVERRRPDEAGGQQLAKCAAPPVSRCSSSCAAVDDEVFTHVTIVDMDRYCFHRCRPEGSLQPSEKVELLEQSGGASFHGGFSISTPCVPVPKGLEAFATDATGSGRDHMLPASVPDYTTLQER